MKKKLTFLFALLCARVMSWAAPTGICASDTYNATVAGYAIHAKVTKGCNKYYLTLTSATEGKTLVGLSGDNMWCNRYSNAERNQTLENYHMAVAGHYTVADGAIVFSIPSIGDPQMYTPLYVKFNDSDAERVINGLQNVRLEPCSEEAAAACPDPEPSIINDVNFALQSNGAVAVAQSGNNPAEAIDNNTGSRWWSSTDAPMTDAEKNDQWWQVDLGQRRIFNTIQIVWEGAWGKSFDIQMSNDAETWTTIKEIRNQDLSSQSFPYTQDIDFAEDKTARYVRFQGIERGTGYAYSFWEFRVMHATAPVLTTYTASIPSTFCTIGTDYQVSVTAKDQLGNDFPVSTTFSVTPTTAGNITAAGMYTPLVAGEATITAEGGGKSATISVRNEVSVNLAYNKTAHAGQDDENAYRANNADLGDRWGSNGGPHPDNDWWYVDLGATFDIAEVAIKWETARPKYYVLETSADATSWNEVGAYDALPASDGSYQIYSGLTAIPGQYLRVRATSTEGGYDNLNWGISIFDFQAFGTENASANKFVSATASPAAGGSVSVQVAGVDVTEVENGTEVTFTATPNEGYDFINWTKGGVEISTNATYVTTITETTALTANFELHRTAYCSTPVTDTQGGTLYLTIAKTENPNEYKILFEGSANNKIKGTNVYVGTGLRLRNVNSVSEYHFSNGDGIWHVTAADESSYGSAYVTFTAADFREISFVNKGVDLYRDNSAGGSDLSSFNAFPDASLIKWDATCADDEAPVLAAPVATPLSGTSVRLALSATDNMAALLTYAITYDGHATPIEVPGAAGETTYYNIKGLSAGTNYTFSVTVSDGTNVSAAQTCTATPSMPTAPVPAHNEAGVLSVYSDKYESALEHDFIKNNWSWPTYSEQTIAGDNMLVYTSDPATQPQMPDVAWGENNDGANAIIAKDGYNDGTNKGLDVRHMKYIHFDMWSAVATAYPELYLNDTRVDGFALNGNGWQSFDIDITTLTDEQKTNIRWIKFIGLRTPNPEEIAIDNVYFWKAPDLTRNDAWMAPGELGTVCIPHGAVATGGDIYELVGKNADGKIVFATVTDNRMEPGKPYLFEAKSNRMDFFYTNDTPAGDPDNSGAMKGTFSAVKLTGAQLNNVYYFAGHALWGCTDLTESGLQVAANRAWVVIDEKMPSASAAPKPGRRYITMNVNGKDVATGFEDVQSGELQCTKVLINGQLFIIRGQRYFDATGRLVK